MRLFKLILVLMLSLTSIKAMSQNKPNIVLVFLDNFGWESRALMAAVLCVGRQHQT